MPLIPQTVYRFGPYELDPDGLVLRRGEEVIALPPKAFDLLSALVAGNGDVLTKEQLLQTVWPNTFVEEGNLTQSIFVLRRKLGQTADGQDYIQTVPRRGYRFVAPIECSMREAAPSPVIYRYEANVQPAIADRERNLETYVQAQHSQTRRGWLLWAIPLCVLLAAAVFVVVLLHSMPSPTGASTYVQLTQDGLDKRGRTESMAGPIAALATDGTRVYFTEGSAETSRLVQVSATGGETVGIPVPFPRPQLFDFSSDRSELLVGSFDNPAAPARLWAVPVLGGVPHPIGNIRALDAAWSPNGQEIVYVSGTELFRARITGEGQRKLTNLPGAGWRPRWSPDGGSLLLTVVDPSTGDQHLWEVAGDGSGLHRILPSWTGHGEQCCGAWSPDGRIIFQASRDSRTELWSLSKPEVLERLFHKEQLPVQITTGPGDLLAPAIDPQSGHIFALGQQLRGELVRFDKASGAFVPYLGGSSMDFPSFTPDGQWLTYVLFPQGTLWRSKFDGSDRLQLTFAPMQVMVPHWSPDGKSIAFYGYGSGERMRVYTISRDGGVPQPITERGHEMNPSWSPDSSELLFSDFPFFGLDPKQISVHIVHRSTGATTDVPGSSGLISPEWSPNGKYLAAMRLDGHHVELFNTQTKTWTDIAEGGGLLKWSHDGEWLYYMRSEGEPGIMRTRVKDRKTEQAVSLSGFRQGGRLPELQFSLAPDDSPVLLRDTGVEEIYSVQHHPE